MVLRNPNNTATDVIVMNQIRLVAPGNPSPNTILLLANIFVEDTDSLQLPSTTFPAALIEAGTQTHKRIGEEFEGLLDVRLTYFDRWDLQPSTMNAIWKGMAVDLDRVMANLQSNDSLATGGVAYLTSIPSMRLSPYSDRQVDASTIPGMTVLKRFLDLSCNILPYDV